MSRVVLIYGSQYGSTERYSRWIAEELRQAGVLTEVVAASVVTPSHLAEADMVVAGLSDYGGLLTESSEVKKLVNQLLAQPLALFTVSFAGLDGATQEKLDGILRKNVGEALVNHASGTFHFRGALDHTRLSLKHKTVMIGIRSAIAAIPKKSEANQQMLDSFSQKSVDYSSPEACIPLVQMVRKNLG